MQKKILLSYIVIILLAIGISATTFWNTGYDYIREDKLEQYIRQSDLIADAFNLTNLSSKDDFVAFGHEYSSKYNVRITVIDLDGNVVTDSDVQGGLEDHGDRAEVVNALKGERSSVVRYSETLGEDFLYSAIPIEKDTFSGVLRVATPISEVSEFNSNIINSIIGAIIVCIIIAILAAFFFTELIYKPVEEITQAAEHISNGDYDVKIYTNENSHIARLASSFNTMSNNLSETIDNLTQRKTELEAILDSIDGGVIALNNEGEILFLNNFFVDIMELKEKEDSIKGRFLYTLFRNVTVYNVIDDVRENNKKVKKEGSGQKRDQIISVTGTPLIMEDMETFGVLLIIEDITQIRKLENVRTDFVSNVTHELKTPLTSIKGFVDTLKNGKVEDKVVADKFLDIIDIEVERLYRLIEDILLLSEIESKIDREAVLCDVNKVALDVIELLEGKVNENVELIFEVQPYIRPYYCNPDRLKELFINLIDNAIKYTEEGSINLICKEENQNLIIIVKDTGIGIPREHLPRVFERFYRVDRGRSRKIGGTGLGLSIVKHIVQLYDGNIEVQSKVNKGSEFKISLPYRYKRYR